MPRTKVARGYMNKRARDNASEIEDILRDYDIEGKLKEEIIVIIKLNR
jgi:hypothetical protein